MTILLCLRDEILGTAFIFISIFILVSLGGILCMALEALFFCKDEVALEFFSRHARVGVCCCFLGGRLRILA